MTNSHGSHQYLSTEIKPLPCNLSFYTDVTMESTATPQGASMLTRDKHPIFSREQHLPNAYIRSYKINEKECLT